ncbi:MAG: PLP-dependent aminotransferase family protein [Nocardioides sp.]|uniref:aminotransferase-like domain-containing protein n=1 Tax=Nocardioides sp. TaxID=35761 RepID=UPI003F083CB3
MAGLEDRSPQGIAGALARAMRSGELPEGTRLPTVRAVAAQLGVSPATVSAAWQALQRNGSVTTRGRAGTYVSAPPAGWLSPRVLSLRGAAPGNLRLDLSRGTPDPHLLPSLERAFTRVSARATTDAYQDAPVLPPLRAELEASWPYEVETITIVNGATDAIARTLEHVVGFGDRVAVESPGFPPIFDLVEALGASVVPLELDGEGVTVRSLRAALKEEPVAVVLQPRAQNPTGVSMTAARAAELADVLRRAKDARPAVIEDDHSGPISGRPPVSLGVHLPDRVVHVRSYSKSHGPDLRIAALGGPAALVEPVIARRMLGPGWTSRMLQTILFDLLTDATSVAEVSAARDVYAARQTALVARLASLGVELGVPDGINLWVRVRDEQAAMVHLAAADIRAAAGSPFHAGSDGAPHVRVTGGLVDADDLDHVARHLVEAARS